MSSIDHHETVNNVTARPMQHKPAWSIGTTNVATMSSRCDAAASCDVRGVEAADDL